MWQEIRDKGEKEVAKDGKRWEGMDEGWQMDEWHHPIGHWSCPMRCKRLPEATSRFWKALSGAFEQGTLELRRRGFEL